MSWTRSIPFRLVVIALLLVVLVANAADGDWTWVALAGALLVLNVVGLGVQLRARARPAAVGPTPPLPRQDDGVMVGTTLAALAPQVPEVAAAWAEGPQTWEQVSLLEEVTEPWPAAEVLEHVYVESDGETWRVAVEDDIFSLVDLDMPEEEDPLLATLRSHPAVADAWHADREVYEAELGAPLELPGFAALAARGLVAHHLLARQRRDTALGA